MSTISVTNLDKQTREITLQADLSLMELLREEGYDEISAMCGGCCSCATCHVYIDPSSVNLEVIEEDEEYLLEDVEAYDKTQSRLSCQVVLNEGHAGMRVQLLDND